MTEQQSPYVSFGLDSPEARDVRGESTDPIIIAVTILGALIAIPALLGLLGSINLSFGRNSNGSTLSALFDLAYLAIGIGLIFRREQARQIYVVLAVISLIFLAIGAIGVLTTSGRSQASGNSARFLEEQIAKVESDPYLPQAVKERKNEALRQRVAETPKTSSSDIGVLIPGLLLTLVPLALFTQERVKRVFV
jgi:hypothetical protein